MMNNISVENLPVVKRGIWRTNGEPIPVLKYCQSEYSALNGCKTLMIGTSTYYRELGMQNPDSLIGDPWEGVGYFVNNDGVVVDKHIKQPETFLFCSSSKAVDDVASLDKSYDAVYRIKDILKLEVKIVNEIAKQLNISNFSEASKEQIQRLMHLNKVDSFERYKNEYIRIRRASCVVTYKKGHPIRLEDEHNQEILYDVAHFMKPESYQGQNEYRSAFLPVDFKSHNGQGVGFDLNSDNMIVIIPDINENVERYI